MAKEKTITTGEASPLALHVEKSSTRTKNYVVDLRIHSPISLGYIAIEGLEPAPAIVKLAKVKRIDMIAVTDFYSAAFIDSLQQAAQGSVVTVLPGVVIRTEIPGCNEVILGCLFPENASQSTVEEFLVELQVPRSASGKRDHIVRRPLGEIIQIVEARGGKVLPSRMDKTPYRMLAIRTLVEQYGFRAFDLAYEDSRSMFKKNWPKIKFSLFSFSSARSLAQVGSRTAKLKMPVPGFDGIRSIIARAE